MLGERGVRKTGESIGDIVPGDKLGEVAVGDVAALRGSKDGDWSRALSCSGEISILG